LSYLADRHSKNITSLTKHINAINKLNEETSIGLQLIHNYFQEYHHEMKLKQHVLSLNFSVYTYNTICADSHSNTFTHISQV